ncbi:MAG: UDP-N-acetylmuramoyl-tripeptide--D-alanyl-D-alanine ligase [gamma proteobacterium symbiont of Bathyaustriella thionipta]|nr:UDP-N-acetylmuramoyl-tripeptide--D-alanyl-D-alanine ligase [gamma proteobacterium symbiont of Bathyaustriella thionipta]MCU7949317.1 UDP-N-acetylmuramoyl-tripeptide--D-alanyl-D-alanine ligase [gamma proteobacterium symbiont of Bathyaustriella thionipta]MCU7953379.1 UDP-N-acetylmuramoyl-tripeptide--D-alanyl-D-alanine ligase [gamma proteobacterium symbiont of Bathyaustriella thionipta]MCU7955898.1 UDP-N-acetylmuramoyl-tripeptide--D-alanyl-D-alanine ligase [gamma proteobacterium symbiont of Bath
MISANTPVDKKTLTLSQVASVLGAELVGEDCSFSQVSINTRTVSEGDLFVAIKGENFDAHEYLEQAEEKGACAVIVEKTNTLTLPQLTVKDTRVALGHIASLWRDNFSLAVVAITGSCGKTTVKEMTTAIFQYAKEQVLATKGNLNNDIGVPLTLMRLNEAHKMAVIEIGANHIGEINQLVHYVKPDVAVITNVAHAHIEGFGSIEGVAKAKAEIYNGLKTNGTAVINADDAFEDYWTNYCQTYAPEKAIKLLTFGLDKPADISADFRPVKNGLELLIKTPGGKEIITLKQYGKHNVYNALAATAVALSSGCTLEQVKFGLENFKNVSGRLEQKQGIADSIIFDDSYNANPGSVRAGIDAIQQLEGDAILILGDMGELGEESEKLHYQLGIDAANMGVKKLFTVGVNSNETCKGFNSITQKQGVNDFNARHFSDKDELVSKVADYLYHSLDKKKIVLVKGSRSMAMESVVDALLEKESLGSEPLSENLTTKGVQ